MSEAEIKLQIIRLVDIQHGSRLLELYQFIQSKFMLVQEEDVAMLTPIELGYQAMAADEQREAEAFDWIESTL
ncbi:MAG: hypothetical protein HC892_23040 [Saprospiraceae bacterium]|nr:hypothetical protein [Saprospiraceae bacterium]